MTRDEAKAKLRQLAHELVGSPIVFIGILTEEGIGGDMAIIHTLATDGMVRDLCNAVSAQIVRADA